MNKPHHPTKTEEIKNLKLLAAILIDLIGMASYIFPGVSELIDAVWAPISAFLVYFLFYLKSNLLVILDLQKQHYHN